MSKSTKIFFIIFSSVLAAGVLANIISEIFKTKLNTYYSIDS